MPSILNNLNLSKIVSGINSTVSTINKAIPIYKEVTPIVKDVRKAFNSFNSVKKTVIEEDIKEQQKYIRPNTIFKQTIKKEERGEVNMDSLTFFQ